jgi:orotidine-5'-phosphate decarboxylase
VSIASKIIVALDTSMAAEAGSLIAMLPDCHLFKVGPHFLFDPDSCGQIFDRNHNDGFPGETHDDIGFFIDMKFFDIPATVERAVYNLAHRTNERSGKRELVFCTVHAHEPVMAAAVKAASGTQLRILAVPLMTSFSRGDLQRFYNYDGPELDFVVERTRRAVDAGCAGVISSAQEVRMLRSNVVPADFLIVVPGTRPDKVARHDHKRTGSPQKAIEDGADYLVIGRPIIEAKEPKQVFDEIAGSVN